MRIGVLGINHKLAELTLREQLAKACHQRFTIGGWRHDDHHFVLLSTCNRTEVYFSSDDLAETQSYLIGLLREDVDGDFEQKLYSFFGSDAFTHVARVTAGLDSALFGETEIQAQVKDAYEAASKALVLPPDLHYAFQKSLKIGKKVRTQLQLGRGIPDITHSLWSAATHLFGDAKGARTLFVGASAINRKICHFLRKKGVAAISLCNRSRVSPERFHVEGAPAVLPWEAVERWHEYDWVIFGTKSPNYLIHSSGIPENLSAPKLVLDLSVPRNVDPKIGQDPRVTLLNIDQIHRTVKYQRRRVQRVMLLAELLIEAETRKLCDIFAAKESYRRMAIGV